MDAQERLKQVSAEYKVVVAHYHWAVEELKRQSRTCRVEDRAHFYIVVEDARKECERIRAIMDRL